jgi:Ca2+-binding EF-hand superfamily protein
MPTPLSVCLCCCRGRSLLLRDAANENRILERAFAFFDKDGNGEIDVAELR